MCWCTAGRCFVWSGQTITGGLKAVRDGFVYDLSTGAWTAMAPTAEPEPRAVENPVWTGTFAAVWGGAATDTVFLRDGAIYVP